MVDQLTKWSKSVYLVCEKSETDKQKFEKFFEIFLKYFEFIFIIKKIYAMNPNHLYVQSVFQ